MNAPTNPNAAGVAASVLSAVPCRLLNLSVTNTDTAPRYITAWDTATMPADGARTGLFLNEKALAPGETRQVDVSPHGIALDHGLCLALSTTHGAKATGSPKLTFSAWIS